MGFVRLLTEKISGGLNSESARPHAQFEEALRIYQEARRARSGDPTALGGTGVDSSSGTSGPHDGPGSPTHDRRVQSSRKKPERRLTSATEIEAALKNGRLGKIFTPFDYTDRAMDTIKRDPAMPNIQVTQTRSATRPVGPESRHAATAPSNDSKPGVKKFSPIKT